MEVAWMGFNIQPPIIHKEYWCTVHNIYWDEPKAMMLYWGEETRRGVKQGVWMLNKNKIPSTWDVRWWMVLPPAKKD